MTAATYKVSEALLIPPETLPAVVFLIPDSANPRFATWRLGTVPFRQVYTEIRKILGQWHFENSELVKRIASFEMLSKKKWDVIPNSDKDRPLFEEFARQHVIPQIVEAAESVQVSRNVIAQLAKCLQQLSEQPRNTSVVSDFLDRQNLSLTINNSQWSGSSFHHQYYSMVSSEAQKRYTQSLNSLQFPLDKVSPEGRKLSIRRFADRVNLGTIEADDGGVKFKYDLNSFLKALFGSPGQ